MDGQGHGAFCRLHHGVPADRPTPHRHSIDIAGADFPRRGNPRGRHDPDDVPAAVLPDGRRIFPCAPVPAEPDLLARYQRGQRRPRFSIWPSLYLEKRRGLAAHFSAGAMVDDFPLE